jgi:hypothetical protein
VHKKIASLVVAAAAAATLASAPAHATDGTNSCDLYTSSAGQSGTCDYVGTGLYTVVDFDQYSGDVDAWVTCTTFSHYYDWSAHEELLTGPTKCTVHIYQYTAGAGSVSITNKVA